MRSGDFRQSSRRHLGVVGETVAAALRSRLFWIVVAIWLATRFLILAQVGFWHGGTIDFEDVFRYRDWSNEIVANHALPASETWQYPPGAAAIMLLPRITGAAYPQSFIGTMLAFDLVGLLLVAAFCRREDDYTGVWIWLFGIAASWVLPVMRFDLAPTVITMGALLAIARRPTWFGGLVGLGATIKVWPALLLFGEWDKRRLLRSAAAAALVALLILLAATIVFGNPASFLSSQSSRGLQNESVASLPWHVRNLITGQHVPAVESYGSYEIVSPAANAVADALKFVSILVLFGAVAWWWGRDRAIRSGRSDLANEATARDFAFTVVLAFVVTSRVLSPQYMIWLLGIGAFILSTRRSRLRRPVWLTMGATLVPAYYMSSHGTILRNCMLLIALCDAIWTLYTALRPRFDEAAVDEISSGELGAAQD